MSNVWCYYQPRDLEDFSPVKICRSEEEIVKMFHGWHSNKVDKLNTEQDTIDGYVAVNWCFKGGEDET